MVSLRLTLALLLAASVASVQGRRNRDGRNFRVQHVLDKQTNAAEKVVKSKIRVFSRSQLALRTLLWSRMRTEKVVALGYETRQEIATMNVENMGDSSEIISDEAAMDIASKKNKLRIKVWTDEMVDASAQAFFQSGLWKARQKEILDVLNGKADLSEGLALKKRSERVIKLIEEGKATAEYVKKKKASLLEIGAKAGATTGLTLKVGDRMHQVLSVGTRNALESVDITDVERFPTIDDCYCNGCGRDEEYIVVQNRACQAKDGMGWGSVYPEGATCSQATTRFMGQMSSWEDCRNRILDECNKPQDPNSGHLITCTDTFMYRPPLENIPQIGCIGCASSSLAHRASNEQWHVYKQKKYESCCGHDGSFATTSYEVKTSTETFAACDSTTNGGYGCFASVTGEITFGAEAVAKAEGCVESKDGTSIISYTACGRAWAVAKLEVVARASAEARAYCSKEEMKCEVSVKVGVEVRATAIAQAGAEFAFEFGGLQGEGKVQITATAEIVAAAEAEATAGCSKSGCELKAQASAEAEAEVHAGGEVSGGLRGPNGEVIVEGEAAASVKASAFAKADASATATFTKDKTELEANTGAIAGAAASAGVEGKVEGMCGTSIGGEAEASGGAQIGAEAEGGFKRDGCTLSSESGFKLAALGGVKLKVSMSINPCCLAEKLFGYVLEAGKWVVDNAKKIFNAAGDAAKAVAEGMKDIAEKAGQGFVDAAHGISVAAQAVGDAIVKGAEVVGEGVVTAANAVADTAKDVGNAVADGATVAANAVAGGVTTAANAVADTATSAVKSIGKAFRRF